ncbi:AAA family ATPase [Pseudosulfitobacter sp. SM2401]|uniref:ParA family protein n=1 Tax=Pseudosulfitobacter sp. SM2401 TaxID=3350098 RepID=UPI0036F205A4
MTTVVSCVNLKGGVGKTTIAVNFAAYCGSLGFKTLLVDLDPQTNATFSCISPETWDAHVKEKGSVADLLGMRNHTKGEGKSISAADVLVADVFEKVDLIPSHLDLFTIDLDIGSRVSRETLLKRALKPVMDDYDIIVCDCPPNLTLPTQNALAVSSHFVVPVSPDFLSSLGIALLLTRVNRLADELDCEIKNAGIVMSRVGRQSLHRSQTTASLREEFGGLVIDTEIKDRSVVSEATARNKSVFQMGNSDAKKEFEAMSEELLANMDLK